MWRWRRKTVRGLLSLFHVLAGVLTTETDDEHARALEEQWIDNLDNAGSASLSQTSPTATTTLQGVLLGFFFPLIPFFFMRVHRPAIFWDDDSVQPAVPHPVFP